MTPTEAIANALEAIALHYGFSGSLYEDLAETLNYLMIRHPRTMEIDLTKENR